MHVPQLVKGWGRVRHVFDELRCSSSVLDVEKGGYSSNHLHRFRNNRFFVHSGVIEVVETIDGKEERTRLMAGDLYDVPAGVVHRFEVLESGIVIEYYSPPEVQMEDIVRFDTGGKR